MKKFILYFLLMLSPITMVAQTCPSTIRVGTSCSCHSCTGTIDVLDYETYIKRVLPQEWYNCWGTLTNGMNALQAGAVAIRSYTIPRIASYVSSHNNGLYDICNTTCCHVYGTTQYTNSNNAVDNTANIVLVSGNTIQLSEYAAEQNNHPNCGNGMKGNNTATWPCTPDGPCNGKPYNGHGRGACQWGTARWATGDVLTSGGCALLNSHGYGTKTWQQILSHYYPNWTLTTCGSNPPLQNDVCSQATVLSSSTSCNYLNSQTVNNATASGLPKGTCDAYSGTPSLADVWYRFQAQATSHTITVDPNGSSLDAVIVAYSNCSGTEIGCSDTPGGNGALSTLTLSGLTCGNTYYIRVYDYGLQTSNGSFRICVTHAGTCGVPDLTISGGTQSLSTSSTAAGSNITAYASLNNQGSASAAATNVGLWLAAGNTLNTNSDIFLGSITGYPSLSSNSNSTIRNASVTIPCNTPPGNYRVFFWADNGSCGSGTNCSNCSGNVNESDECNNFASVYLLSVTACCTPPTSPTSATATFTTINQGQPTTLQVNGGALNSASNWIWYTGSCGGTQVGTGSSLSVSPTTTTTYYVQASACNVATTCRSVTINVVSCTPPVSPSSASASQTTINAGQSTTLQVSGGALNSASNWVWYTGSCGGTQVGTGPNLNVSPTVTTTYYVQASACNVTTTCQSVTINVVSCTPPVSPTSASASQTTINAGQSTTLQVNGGALNSASNWIWYTGSCGGAQVGTGATLAVSPNVTTTYYVQASACNITTSCQSVTITVNSNCLPPTVQASGIVFNNVGPNSIRVLFNAGNGEKRIVKMNITNSFSPPVNGTDPIANSNYAGSGEQVIYNGTDWGVDVTGLNPNTNYCFRVYEYNCSGGATVYLTSEGTNNPRCNFSAANCSTVPPPINLSPGSTTYPGPTVSGNISFNWSTTGASNYRFELRKEPFRIIDIMASSCGSSGPPITTTHTYQNGVKYRWTVTSVQGSCSGGCQTVSADYYFIYDVGCTLPGPVTVSGGGTYCNSTILTASGGAGGTIFWQGTNANGTNLTTASTTQTVTSSGTYYFRSYHPSCGWGPQGSATVTIENPVGPLTVNGGGTFCNNAVITAVGGTGGTIYWQGTNSNGTSTATPTTSQTVSASGTYYFRAYNSCGWGPSVGVTIVINVPPACGAQLPPDLTSSQFFSSLQITNGSYIDEVVVIRNVGSGPTTAPIVFGITNYNLLTGLSVSLNPASSVTIGPETYVLDNINWTFDPVAGTFTSNAGVGILPGGTKNIGIRFARTGGANGTVNQTTTIAANTGGGDITIANNSISNIFLKY